MTTELKEAFKSEFYISTRTIQPDCKLWHSLGMHVCPDGISIFEVNYQSIIKNGVKAQSIEDLKSTLKGLGFKWIKGEKKALAPASIHNYDVAITIIQDFDVKMDPETKKTHYY